jgi:hypothetical protein
MDQFGPRVVGTYDVGMVNHPNHGREGDASAVLKAGDIEPAVRQWAASVLHVDLTDADELTLGLRRAADRDRSARQPVSKLSSRFAS